MASRRVRQLAAGALSTAALTLALGAPGIGSAQAATGAPHASASGWTHLTLINGWTPDPSTFAPAVRIVSGIVYFRGAIEGGNNSFPFVLPKAFRPAAPNGVVIKISLCHADSGRLDVGPSGVVSMDAQGGFTIAQCLTSLDGASYALTGSGFTKLTPINGWGSGPPPAAARIISGLVHLRGVIFNFTSDNPQPFPFVLPSAFRPAKTVFVPVDMCNTNGRLLIQPSGVVTVQDETDVSKAACSTSLDGASYALTGNGFTKLALINGWTASAGPAAPAARTISGIVHLRGAITTNTSNPSSVPFVLPPALRPFHLVVVPVDTCGATNGELIIFTDGTGFLQGQDGDTTPPRCFTSLEGVSYSL